MNRLHHSPRGTAVGVRAGRRLFAALASLRLAVILLSLFTFCLAVATVLEASYGARTARDLIYRAWWFSLLLVLLAANVLGAALKKYPWRRHQTGFLVTHAGLLVLLLGGLLTAWFGVEGQMVLVDTPNRELQARLGLSNSGESLHVEDLHQIDVLRVRPTAGASASDASRFLQAVNSGLEVPDELREWVRRQWSFPVNPGVFTWWSDDIAARRLPWSIALLDRFASPWPGIVRQLDNDVNLEVLNYYPHVEADPHTDFGLKPREVRPGSDAAARLPSALRCRLAGLGVTQGFAVVLSGSPVPVRIGEATYLVRYRRAMHPVPFTLTLQRAWQLKDPGSERPAWFQSDVTLTHADESRDESVSMNRTLGHGAYKVYQANYQRITDPVTGGPLLDGDRPVSLSGLAVAHDPGLWFKYAGSLIVTAGIAIMFWMKAYFFKPRPFYVSRSGHQRET